MTTRTEQITKARTAARDRCELADAIRELCLIGLWQKMSPLARAFFTGAVLGINYSEERDDGN